MRQRHVVRKMLTHFEPNHWYREGKPEPEPPGHLDELRIGARIASNRFGLQPHTADRTRTRTNLPNLRMHRAGINRAFRS